MSSANTRRQPRVDPAGAKSSLLRRLERHQPDVHDRRGGFGLRLDGQSVPAGLLDRQRPDLAGLEVLEVPRVLDGELQPLVADAHLDLTPALTLATPLENFHAELTRGCDRELP